MAKNEANNVESTKVSKKVSGVFGYDSHFWEQWMLVSLAIVGAVTVAAALFTAAVVISQRRENIETKAEFAKYKVDVGNEIAAAQSVGDIAKKDAAEANARALEAQLALEKLKSPRMLNDDQRVKLVEALKPFSGFGVMFLTNPADSEANGLSNQLQAAFREANWNVAIWRSPEPILEHASGIIIELVQGADEKNTAAATSIREVLLSSGIAVPFSVSPLELGNPSVWIRITVGRKPI